MNRAERRRLKDQKNRGEVRPLASSVNIRVLFDQAVGHHREGQLDKAELLYQQILQRHPQHADSYHFLGLIAYRRRRHDQAIDLISHAIKLDDKKPHYYFNLGLVSQDKGQLKEAVQCYEKAVRIKPDYVEAYTNLGNVHRDLGDLEKAVESYQRALQAKPDYADGHNNLGVAFKEQGKLDQAVVSYRQALGNNPKHVEALNNLGMVLKQQGKVQEAGQAFQEALKIKPDYSKVHHNLGLVFLWKGQVDDALACFMRSAEQMQNHGGRISPQPVYKARMKHDAEQIRYLFDKGLLNDRYISYLQALERLCQKAREAPDASPRITLSPEELTEIAPSFNRILYSAECPALPHGALNPKLDAEEIQQGYHSTSPEIIYVDGLVTLEALQSLRKFCRESTIWKKDYENGYIGALLGEGFACPLLLQIAEELRLRFPRIFHDHRLVQSWAFKQDSEMKGLNIHADAAAVNVNFWITEDEANLDPSSGGLTVWDKEAPRDWDFKIYNNTTFKPKIFEFLKEAGAKAVTVPYRENRACIFNSDLFHETDRCDFRDGYAHRRINITMLYGYRASSWTS